LLRWRLISAAVILSVLLTLVWLDYRLVLFGIPGIWLLPVLLAVALLGTQEVLALFAAKGHRPVGWILYLGNALIVLAACLPMLLQLAGRSLPANHPLGPFGWPLVAVALASVGVLMAEMQRFERPGTATVDAALGIFTLVYVGLLGSFFALLRQHDGNGRGMAALVSMLFVVKLADVGAYAFGKNLGRHKMSPVLSPGKTWEGAFGGLLTACLASWIVFQYLAPLMIGYDYRPPGLARAMAYGVLLALAGMIGDLAESLLKRDMQRKDSSSWVPGLGGVLDIIDAVLVAAPVAWLCWVLGLV
jgi:phosphatidate cytidylyltransferase